MVIRPDSECRVRPGCETQAVEVWNKTSSRLHFNRDFRLNSQSLAACITVERSIGGRAWPNFLAKKMVWEEPLVLCANITLGLMAFWWVGTRQQQGRANITNSRLPDLPVLDVRTLDDTKLARAKQIFRDFRERELLPANEAYRDQTRKDLDRAVLCDLFGLPEDILEPLAVLRNQWCAEPSVHGGKQTRIGRE